MLGNAEFRYTRGREYGGPRRSEKTTGLKSQLHTAFYRMQLPIVNIFLSAIRMKEDDTEGALEVGGRERVSVVRDCGKTVEKNGSRKSASQSGRTKVRHLQGLAACAADERFGQKAKNEVRPRARPRERSPARWAIWQR